MLAGPSSSRVESSIPRAKRAVPTPYEVLSVEPVATEASATSACSGRHFPADWGIWRVPNSQRTNVAGSMVKSGGGTSGCAWFRPVWYELPDAPIVTPPEVIAYTHPICSCRRLSNHRQPCCCSLVSVCQGCYFPNSWQDIALLPHWLNVAVISRLL